MQVEKLIENRLSDMKGKRTQLVEAWKPYITAIDTYLKGKGKDTMEDYQKQNVAQCLENALIEGGMRQRSRIFETTWNGLKKTMSGKTYRVLETLRRRKEISCRDWVNCWETKLREENANQQPSRVKPRKVQRLLEEDTSSLITSSSAQPQLEQLGDDIVWSPAKAGLPIMAG